MIPEEILRNIRVGPGTARWIRRQEGADLLRLLDVLEKAFKEGYDRRRWEEQLGELPEYEGDMPFEM